MAMKINDDCIACGACLPECPTNSIAEDTPVYVIDAASNTVIARVADVSGGVLYQAAPSVREIRSAELKLIQEGLRGVVRLPDGTAHSLDGGGFPIPVMGKTGTTSNFRDALFVGSTYGPQGITVAVRIGFDDNRELGGKETGGRAALPIFREIMLRVYKAKLVGPAPKFPREIEEGIDRYLALQAQGDTLPVAASAPPPAPASARDGHGELAVAASGSSFPVAGN